MNVIGSSGGCDKKREGWDFFIMGSSDLVLVSCYC